MKKTILLISCICTAITYAQAPAFEWAKKIGGNSSEQIKAVA